MTFEEFCKFSYSPCMITQLDGARIVRENVLFHSFFFFLIVKAIETTVKSQLKLATYMNSRHTSYLR